MRAEAHGKLFARTAVQESAYGQRIKQVVALRGERADHTGKHITAAALGRCQGPTVMRTRPSGAAMTVRLPLSGSQPYSAVNARAVCTRLRLISSTPQPVKRKAPSDAV